LIEDSYKIIFNGHYYFTKEFNTHDISKGFLCITTGFYAFG
jgi:hypothetical protein